jgi:hypothetical protein
MAEYTKETVTTEEGETVQPKKTSKRESTGVQTVQYVIYYIFGAIELLLAFRMVLRLFGANPDSSFVNGIYNFSAGFVWPFLGIFPNPTTEGAVTTAVFEPATLVAIIVYALFAWGVAKLISIFAGERQE